MRNLQCMECNKTGIDDDMFIVGSEILCQDCFDKRFFYCDNMACCARELLENAFKAPNGDLYCSACFSELCFVCSKCGKIDWESNALYELNETTFEAKQLCQQCA